STAVDPQHAPTKKPRLAPGLLFACNLRCLDRAARAVPGAGRVVLGLPVGTCVVARRRGCRLALRHAHVLDAGPGLACSRRERLVFASVRTLVRAASVGLRVVASAALLRGVTEGARGP